ncbi:MAG: FRG domain-containing protein [Sedimentisphaerales bacterium]|nr:FRG domain-containing protein [Sedimentisphaerales bacterium]
MNDYVKDVKNGMLVHTFDSWEKFVEFVKNPDDSWPTLIYRGQANSDWKVESTLDRIRKRYPTTPNLGGFVPKIFGIPRVGSSLQIKRFKEIARGEIVISMPRNEGEWWGLAQHHGLATPLLDWTYFPLIALFFAFEDEKCNIKGKLEEPDNRAVFALAHHLLPKETNAPRVFSPSEHASYRLTNQGGLFLRMPDPEYIPDNGGKLEVKHLDLETYMTENFKKETYKEPCSDGSGNPQPISILQKFIISSKDRVNCLRFLDYANINRASLFPDLDGAARYVNDLWEVNFDKTIGHINED